MTEEPRARSTTGDLLHLIEQLAGFDRVGVTRLARHLGVPAPTAYRMLRALERAGYVEQLAESKEYRLTLKLFELGRRVARCVAAPILGVRQTRPAAVSVSAYRPELDAAEEERLGRLVIAAASRISGRLGALGNMDSW
jgi:DNA-binding IclR family transcriptional regulator